MKNVILNGKSETMADDSFKRAGFVCELKEGEFCTHRHEGTYKDIDVEHPYYVKGRQFPNGSISYYPTPNKYESHR